MNKIEGKDNKKSKGYKKYLIGEKFKNNKGLEYEIIGYCESCTYRIIRFVKSGYETKISAKCINTGCIHDYLHKNVCDVGIMDIKGGEKHPLKKRWENMIRRCYDVNDPGYKTYGATGVYVCDEWLTFSNYVRDVEQKENYDKLLQNRKNWHIDKDITDSSNRCYSNETTMIVTSFNNNIERIQRRGNPNGLRKVNQYTMEGVFIRNYESIREAERLTGTRNGEITRVCKGKRKSSNGFKWSYVEMEGK